MKRHPNLGFHFLQQNTSMSLAKITKLVRANKNMLVQPPIELFLEEIDEKLSYFFLISDIVCRMDSGILSWNEMCKLLEEELPKEYYSTPIKVTTKQGSNKTSQTTTQATAKYRLHRIVSHPKLLPYIDMIHWVVENASITKIQFVTSRDTIISSFKLEHLHGMYKLSERQLVYNSQFVDSFMKEECNNTQK